MSSAFAGVSSIASFAAASIAESSSSEVAFWAGSPTCFFSFRKAFPIRSIRISSSVFFSLPGAAGAAAGAVAGGGDAGTSEAEAAGDRIGNAASQASAGQIFMTNSLLMVGGVLGAGLFRKTGIPAIRFTSGGPDAGRPGDAGTSEAEAAGDRIGNAASQASAGQIFMT